MKRNCYSEIRLAPPSLFPYSTVYNGQHNSMLDKAADSRNEKQQLTIFYNGSVATCDVTERQARAIISLATSGEMDEKSKILTRSKSSSVLLNSPLYSPTAYSPTTNLSMKRSLQRFLQKRKTRTQAACPYPIPNPKPSQLAELPADCQSCG